MKFYPQLILWTYVLLPAISLLLTPTFIIAIARAQQQRAKIMMNALNARGRAAAAIARTQQRRYIPNNRYLNGFGPNKPFKFRSKRQLEGVHDIVPPLIRNPNEPDTFERKSHWDQQEEALGQLANMWNMNNFGNTQSDDVIRSNQDKPEEVMEDRVGDPFINNHKNHQNDRNSDYYSGAFFGRNVFDEVLEQRDPLALIQNKNGAQFIEDRAAGPEPTLNKKKFGIKQDVYPQSYYNSYNPQHSYPSTYYRSADLEDPSRNIPMEANEMERIINGNPTNDERLGSPEPTFKKLKELKKKKLGEEHVPYSYPPTYYNSYYPQHSYSNAYNSYSRSAEIENVSQNPPMADNMPLINGDQTNDERLGSPEPTFKKLKELKKKKLGEEHVPYSYPPTYYNSYYPQHAYSNGYNSYSRSAEMENVSQNPPMADNRPLINGNPTNEEKLGSPEPTFKKLKELKKKKFGGKHEPYSYPSNYYNSYYPQQSYTNTYNAYSRSAEIEDISQHPLMADDMLFNNGEQLQNMEPKSADPDPFKKVSKFGKKTHSYVYPQNNYNSYSNSHYNPYSREAETQTMHQDIQEHEMDDFMISELVAPRFAHPEPTFKKKKKKEVEHRLPSFYYPPTTYYPETQYIHYYPSNPYYNSNNNPYSRSGETKHLDHNDATKRSVVNIGKVGEENPFEEQKSAEQHHGHHMTVEKKNLNDDERDVNPNGANMSNKEVNSNLPALINEEKPAEEIPKVRDDTQNKNSPQTSGNDQNARETAEEVGCELEEKIEEKLQKKLKKLLKDDKRIDYPYPAMYPPSHNYGGEYEQPEYYRSASGTDQIDETIKDKVDEQKSPEAHLIEPIKKLERDVVLKQVFSKKLLPMDEGTNVLNQQTVILRSPTSNQESISTNAFDQDMVNSRSSLAADQAQPEEVGCKIDDKLFESSSSTKALDPYSYYQRAVEGISEEGQKIAEETKKLLLPQEQQPATPVEPKLNYIDMDQVHSDLIPSKIEEYSTSLEEKPANRNADPTLHSRGFTHTHSHFSSHTHEKTIGTHHGANNLYSVTPQIHHSQVLPHQQGFSQANAKAQTFTHGGVQHSSAHANSNSFGNGFGSNIATAQSGSQTFNNGPINGFGSTGPQTFSNDGFGQSSALAGSLIQSGGQFSNFGLNSGIAQAEAQAQSGQITGFVPGGAIAQSGAQALNNGGFAQSTASTGSIIQNRPAFIPIASQPTFNNGGIGQAAASASSVIQNGPTFVPNTQPTFNHGGFGQATAQASAQAGVTGFNGVQNFGNGFQNTQPLIFNNPTQFASSSANAQIVGQPRESFVMPHLDEIPVHDLMSRMEFDRNRFSRTPQDFRDALTGLGLASKIVDMSLNKKTFSNDNVEEIPSHEGKDNQKPMDDFVTNIVDSSIRAGENIDQNDHIVKAPPNSESARHLTLQGISSITDLVSKGLRLKRQAIIEDNNFNNEQIILDDNMNKAEKPKDNNSDILVNPISKVEAASKDGKVLSDQKPDSSLQISDKTNERLDDDMSGNHNKDMTPAPGTTTSENSGIRNNILEGVASLEIVDSDSFASTPKVATSQLWTANETDGIIYVTQTTTKDILTKDKVGSKFDGANADTTTENVILTLPVNYTESINNFSEAENLEKVLMTNAVTESYNVAVHDDINNNTSTKNYQRIDVQPQNSTEITENSAEESQNHTETSLPVDNFRKEDDNGNTRSNSFLGLEHKDSNINVYSRSFDIEKDKSFSGNDITDELNSTEIPKEILEKYLFFPNGTRKNISELTSDEISELQFDLPNNSTETNILVPEHRNNATEETILGLDLQNNKDFTEEPKDNLKEFEQKQDAKSTDNKMSRKEEANSTNMVLGDSFNVPDITHDSFQQDFIQKLMTNMSDGPLASLEAEMSVLTDEEKKAFIQQEVHLVAQVIEESIKNITSGGATSQEPNPLKDLTHGTKTETKKKDLVVASPNIFQAIGRENDREEYSRQAQGKSAKEEMFDTLLGQQREKVEKIKNVADDDNDLLMISFIGDSIIKDLEHRRNKNDDINQPRSKELNQTMDDTILIIPDNRVDKSDALNQTTSIDQSNEPIKTNESVPVKTKRAITGVRSSRAPLTQLIADPTMKLNMEKTLQNLGSIARHTFENPKAPMYHVRNMLGNAKNSVMSAAKLPPNNFLIPSKYEIAKIARDKNLNGEKVGAVNQQMLSSRSAFENTEEEKGEEPESDSIRADGDSFGFENTVQKIGGMVKESVQTGKDALMHVNDVATDAKKILHTSKYAAPRFILPRPQPMLTSRGAFTPTTSQLRYSPYTPHFNTKTMEPRLGVSRPKKPPTVPLNRKTVLIAPKLFDIQENVVGDPQEDSDNFLGMGHIFDAVGFSQPNQPEVELQKIEYEPLRNTKPFAKTNKHLKLSKKPLPASTTSTSKPSSADLKKDPNDNTILGVSQVNETASQDLLQDGEHKADRESLQEFMQRMHNEMKEIVRLQYEDRKKMREERIKNPKTNQYFKNQQDPKNYKKNYNKNNYNKNYENFEKNYKKRARESMKYITKQNEMLSPILRNVQSFYNLKNNDVDENVEMISSPKASNIRQTDANLYLAKKNNDGGIPTLYSRFKQNPSTLDISLPVTSYAEKYPYKAQYLQSQNSDSANDKEKVGLFLPEDLLKPFMGQPSEALIGDYMRQNGDEEVLERKTSVKSKKIPKLPEIQIPKLQPLNINNPAPKSYDLKKLAISPQLPLTPVDLQVPEIFPLLSPNSAIDSTIKSEIVSAFLPERIINKTSVTNSSEIKEKTKEFVEFLSDPEIKDSEENMQTTTSRFLASTTKDNDVLQPSSVVKQPNTEPLSHIHVDITTENNVNIQNIARSSLEADTKEKVTVKPSIVNNPVPSGLEKPSKIVQVPITPATVKYDNTVEPKNANLIDNVKQTRSSDLKKNQLIVGHVPDDNDLGYVLGAINPMMFERHFNERLKINDTSSKDTHNKFLQHGVIKQGDNDGIDSAKPGYQGEGKNEPLNKDETFKTPGKIKEQKLNENRNDNNNEKVVEAKAGVLQEIHKQVEDTDAQGRTSMKVLGPYKKPFMGYIKTDEMHKFLNQYNNQLLEEHDGEQQEEYTPHDIKQENIDTGKKVIFSSLDDGDEYENYGY